MDTVDIKISNDLIKPIIENKVKAAVISALGDESKLIETVIDTVLQKKVNSKGNVDNYSSYNTHTFIDVVLKDGIQNACRDAIKEYILENKSKIKDEVRRQLSTKTGTSQFVSSFLNGMIKASESEYRFKADFKFESLKDD